jgi:hypothetical protein
MSMRNAMVTTAAVVGLLLLTLPTGAFAQLGASQQKCLNAINKDGSAVARTQGKESIGCLKAAGKGTLVGTAQACLTADAKGKVGKAKNKTTADETKNCTPAPSFGYTSAATINTAAASGEVDLTADVFGPNLDAAVISCTTNKPGCVCQQKVQKVVEQLAALKLATFIKCKKAAIAAGATSATALEDCVRNGLTPGSIAADSKGKIAKTVTGLNTAITKSCDTPGVTAGSFPGVCNAFVDGALTTCLDTHVECRVCQMINEMDGLFVNCDLFDNGVADATCASGTGPTPTPTPTLTPTPSPTSTFQPGTIIKGSLTQTFGRFNYNLTLGLTGANNACATNFGAGVHACTLTELQNAEAAGELDGLTDTASQTVTGFWAIDPAADPLTRQCYDDVTFPCPGGVCGTPGHNWEYGTAHTASRGQRIPLNNGTGVLGALITGLQCNGVANKSWVGCCL